MSKCIDVSMLMVFLIVVTRYKLDRLLSLLNLVNPKSYMSGGVKPYSGSLLCKLKVCYIIWKYLEAQHKIEPMYCSM